MKCLKYLKLKVPRVLGLRVFSASTKGSGVDWKLEARSLKLDWAEGSVLLPVTINCFKVLMGS
jgi:hypothetical protein